MSRGYSVEQWAEWIDEQRASGLSIAAFCESIGVSQNAFYVRRRRLAEQTQRSEGEPCEPCEPCEQPGAAGFVSLKLADGEHIARERIEGEPIAQNCEGSALVEIEMPGSVVVRVNDRQLVADIVSVILERGAQR